MSFKLWESKVLKNIIILNYFINPHGEIQATSNKGVANLSGTGANVGSASTCEQEPKVKLLTLQLVDKPQYLLSHSCPV